MSILIERAIEQTPGVCDLIEELNGVLGADYDAHQRHGLSIKQLFQLNVRLFLARLDGFTLGCGVIRRCCSDRPDRKPVVPVSMSL